MKRRTALALIPAAVSAQTANNSAKKKIAKRVKAVAANSPEYYECQALSFFIALLVTGKNGSWVDVFQKSSGAWPSSDTYFGYTTKEAFAYAYTLLVTQKKYQSLLSFQSDFRKFSTDMVTYLSSLRGVTLTAGPYPDICPFEDDTKALLDALQP